MPDGGRASITALAAGQVLLVGVFVVFSCLVVSNAGYRGFIFKWFCSRWAGIFDWSGRYVCAAVQCVHVAVSCWLFGVVDMCCVCVVRHFESSDFLNYNICYQCRGRAYISFALDKPSRLGLFSPALDTRGNSGGQPVGDHGVGGLRPFPLVFKAIPLIFPFPLFPVQAGRARKPSFGHASRGSGSRPQPPT